MYKDTTFKATHTTAEASAMNSIYSYFSSRYNYYTRKTDTNSQTARKYYDLAKTKEADDWLISSVDDLIAESGQAPQ